MLVVVGRTAFENSSVSRFWCVDLFCLLCRFERIANTSASGRPYQCLRSPTANWNIFVFENTETFGEISLNFDLRVPPHRMSVSSSCGVL